MVQRNLTPVRIALTPMTPSPLDSPSTGDNIASTQGNWEFTAQVAQNFDSHVRKSVPFYDVTQQLVLQLSDWFVYKGATVYDIGCATGTTLMALAERHSAKQLKLIGVDESTEMLAKVGGDTQLPPNIELLGQDIFDVDLPPASASLILSLYTLQFIPTQKRGQLLRKLYSGLARRGAFILVEKVLDSDALLTDIYIQQHWEQKRSMGFDVGEIYNKAAALRGVLTPLSTTENIQMLQDAGFDRVSVCFKWCNFAAFIAIKS
jgi:tRNA (cmo5U34)-methyltransferase